MENQLTILPPDNETTSATTEAKATMPERKIDCTCEQCKKEYKAAYARSRFCSDKCRVKFFRTKNASMKAENTTKSLAVNDSKETKEKEPRIPQPVFQNISPPMAIAVQMLQKDADRWERLYNEERKKAIDLDKELTKLKDESRDKEYKTKLDGIEAQKPDFLDRVLAGLGNIPAPIIEQIAPIIGRITGALIPGDPNQAGPQQIGGVQLDEMSTQLLQWISTLDEQNRNNLFIMIGKMMNMDNQKLSASLTKAINLFKNGQLNGHHQPSPNLGLDMSMYGG